jgi:hypothetical protein
MSLARLPAAIVLASLAAILAHLAGFGTSHVMGGAHGAEFLGAILGAGALLAMLGLGRIAFARRRLSWREATELLSETLPFAGPPLQRAALLLAGAVAIFSGSEALEGRGFEIPAWAFLALPLAAAALAYTVRGFATWLARLGLTLRAAFADAPIALGLPVFTAVAAPAIVRSSDIRRAHRGRAPPHVA